MNNLIAIGFISSTKGLKGQVVIRLFQADSHHLEPGQIYHLKPLSKQLKLVTLQKKTAFEYVVSFEGINRIEEASLLKGAEVQIETSLLKPLEADEYYIKDLIGNSVYFEEQKVGTVENIFSFPQDTVEIRLINGNLISLPLMERFFKKIEIQAKKLTLNQSIESIFIEDDEPRE